MVVYRTFLYNQRTLKCLKKHCVSINAEAQSNYLRCWTVRRVVDRLMCFIDQDTLTAIDY